MKNIIKNAIEEYQCPGCVSGSDIECFKNNDSGVGCGKHCAGTNSFPTIGRIFLGLPNGFNRLGEVKMKPYIFESYESSDWKYDTYNRPTWKYLNENGHTLVRGLMPRTNQPFLHIFLENCIDKIDCLEITQYDVNEMD